MKYLFLSLFLSGCAAADTCKAEELQCDGQKLEICNADGNWEKVADCATVTPGAWECCETLGTCVMKGGCK